MIYPENLWKYSTNSCGNRLEKGSGGEGVRALGFFFSVLIIWVLFFLAYEGVVSFVTAFLATTSQHRVFSEFPSILWETHVKYWLPWSKPGGLRRRHTKDFPGGCVDWILCVDLVNGPTKKYLERPLCFEGILFPFSSVFFGVYFHIFWSSVFHKNLDFPPQDPGSAKPFRNAYCSWMVVVWNHAFYSYCHFFCIFQLRTIPVPYSTLAPQDVAHHNTNIWPIEPRVRVASALFWLNLCSHPMDATMYPNNTQHNWFRIAIVLCLPGSGHLDTHPTANSRSRRQTGHHRDILSKAFQSEWKVWKRRSKVKS